ncbi:hypothetical protein PV326_010576 [Microctonus aethiopoides]|nr:hypothetical protein PV326_010576 [Microctonus aethiopoides]
MEKHRGSRPGSAVYKHNEFLYHADTNYRGRRFVCIHKTSKRPCRVSALCDIKGDVTLSGQHNHRENSKLLIKKWATSALKKLAREKIHLSPREVINRVFAMYPSAEVWITPHAARYHVTNARAKILPNIPKTLNALAVEMLVGSPKDPNQRPAAGCTTEKARNRRSGGVSFMRE